jgi:hypothetical protein
MSHHRLRLQKAPQQLLLIFEDAVDRPPPAPATPAVMETLAEILLAALSTPKRSSNEEVGHEPEDHC